MNRSQRRIADLPHDVYKAYGAAGELLYVGCSVNVFKRLREHKQYAAWYQIAEHVEVARYPDRLAALAEEARCIAEDGPEFNVTREWQRPERLTDEVHERFALIHEDDQWWIEEVDDGG